MGCPSFWALQTSQDWPCTKGRQFSPPFQRDLTQKRDYRILTWWNVQKCARLILLCHELIFSRCWKVRKCNYGKIALRQTSTCQILPLSIIHLSLLIVADNTPSVYALSREKVIPRRVSEQGSRSGGGSQKEQTLKSHCQALEPCSQELWVVDAFFRCPR